MAAASDPTARGASSTAYDAIIVAGGRGERLGGVDKALVEVGGQTLLGYAVSAASQAAHVVVVGAPRPGFEHLTWTSEQPPGGGPAAGVIAGLEVLNQRGTQSPWVVLLAADQPGVEAAVREVLRAAAQADDDTQALCPYGTDGRAQWLLAAYRREVLQAACAPLGTGHGSSMGQLLRGIKLLDVPEASAHVGDIDTWADHLAWEGRLGS